MHARRIQALWRGVEGLLAGGSLWLTGLGRALPGGGLEKHRIKAADRLLGNKALHSELPSIYRALAGWLLRLARKPVVAVDWTGVGANHYALSASVCVQGRALPVFSRVYPKKRVNNPRAQLRFLHALSQVLPDDCRPIIVTDVGFHLDWFEGVRALGWDFVGRVRNTTKARVDGEWTSVSALHRRATKHPSNIGWFGCGGNEAAMCDSF